MTQCFARSDKSASPVALKISPHSTRATSNASFRKLTPRAENTDSLIENGAGSVLWAPPGVTTHERVLVDMSAGETYALLCAFRDADSLPQHIQLGMVAVLEVD